MLTGSSSIADHAGQPEVSTCCTASHFISYRPLDVEERGFRSFQIQTEKRSEPPDLTLNSPVWCLIFKASRYTTFDMQISTLSPRHLFFFRIIKHQPSTTPSPQQFFQRSVCKQACLLFLCCRCWEETGKRLFQGVFFVKGLNRPVTLIEGHREQKNKANA